MTQTSIRRINAMDFFRQSAGKWRSQRTTHHLAFRQAEMGGSEIQVTVLDANDPKVVEICQMHGVDPTLAAGGAFVTWDGTMDWDKEDENHKGQTVFAIVPDPTDDRKGQMLRERGYAEIIPVAGEFAMDEDDALILTTEYETMSSVERFWFPQPNIRMRTSAVKRFGGYNTSTFCTEVRVDQSTPSPHEELTTVTPEIKLAFYSSWGW